jgi:putative ABC transport system permease protein
LGSGPIHGIEREETMFDLETAIARWRKRMGADPGLEPGFVAEIESHLRDKIDALVGEGRNPEEAFQEAARALGESALVGSDFTKVYAARRSGRPSWKAPRFIPALFWNYLRTTSRFLRRHRGFAALNIAGLAVGMLSFLLIMAWVRNELSYDRFHEKLGNLYMILSKDPSGQSWNTTTYALPPALKSRYPEVADYARVWPWNDSLVRYGDIRFDEDRITLTDPGFFRMFSFPFVRGNPETALADLNSIVLTEETARRYFGDEDPIGKVLHLDSPGQDFTVTGVVKNVPSNSSIRFDMVSRVEWLGEDRLARWGEFVAFAYVQLRPGVSLEIFNRKIEGIFQEQLGPDWPPKPFLQPFSKSYLFEGGRPGVIVRVVVFSGIAVLILLMACVNFMSLSTAQASQRAREVGLRKVVGAGRTQIARQFLTEGILLSGVSLATALTIAPLVLPVFNRLAGKELKLLGPGTGGFVLIAGLAALVTGLLSASYPAVLLSSFRPVETLRNRVSTTPGGAAFRKILIIFQFSASVALILSAIVVSRQLHFVRGLDLGFTRDGIVTVENNLQILPKMRVFRAALAGEKGIRNVTFAAQRPLSVGQTIGVDWEGNTNPVPARIGYTMVDYGFFETFGMEIIRGRSFSPEFAADETESCIVNEAAARMFGWDDPIGHTITWSQGAIDPSLRNVRIVGVVKDFYDRSLRAAIRPFMFRIYRPWCSYIFVQVDENRIPAALAAIKKVFETFAPDYPFHYEFLDEAFDRQYAQETQQGRLFTAFGLLSIFVAVLGLIGLAAFTAERRTKEIGIRKVLGASVSGLVAMMTKEYLVWVAAANLIAWPVGYFFMARWLDGFANRIPLGAGPLLEGSAVMLVVVLAAVSGQTFRAARANPVDSLRYE